MIHDLDKSIKHLLESELTHLQPAPAITFAPPDGTFAPTGPTVDLFLYDVQENRPLRQWEPVLERQDGGTVVKRQPPVRVDCSYLVTAWSADAENEHLLLGEVMQALLRHPAIPAEFLQGVLARRPAPLPVTALQPGRLQSLGEFWQAMGGKPRAALHYTVTLAVPLDKEPLTPIPVAKAVMPKLDRKEVVDEQTRRS